MSYTFIGLGSAYGCSQYVLSDEIDSHPGCAKRDILLRTIPPYVVQAEYCKCDGDLCNGITHITAIPQRRTSYGRNSFYVNNAKNSLRPIHFHPLHPLLFLVLFLR
ncbi:hypothetical protein Q1695_013013 [Nippostrongylus brasiliensis]|nr:hypothetical protein Q1695_013013 [Nippostrongylus brasiliensis]